MDNTILAAEFDAARGKRKKALTGYSIAVLAFVLIVTVPTVLAGEPLFAVFIAGGVVVSIGLIALLSWAFTKGKNLTGPAPIHPVTRAQVYTRRPPANAWGAVSHRLTQMGITFHQIGPTTLTGGKGADLFSWGTKHLVDVRPSGDHPGYTVVTVLSTPTVPLAITDYGRNAKLTNQILAAVL